MQQEAPRSHLDLDTQAQIALKRQLIHDLRLNQARNLTHAQQQAQSSVSPPRHHHTSTDSQTDPDSLPCTTAAPQIDKNPGVSDTNRMVFDKKFKNYLNHRQEYLERARGQLGTQRPAAKGAKKEYLNLGEAEYYNEEEVLSNTGSEYQYQNASDMQAAYEEMTTGKKRKGGRTHIFPPELYENQLRRFEFENQLAAGSEEEQKAQSMSKDRLLNYLFDEPILMMLYSINPYQLGDQLSDFQTQRNDLLNYQEFSDFLLSDREPTYVDYTQQNLAEAHKLGRGIKCAPIIAKWVDDSGIFEFLIETYRSIDIRGDGLVDRSFLARKLRKEALERRITEAEVIEIVNINKMVPLNRLLYELEFEEGRQEPTWSEEEFIEFLTNYSRKITPEKDKLITKLILTGKYDSSYIFVVSQEAIEFIKEVFDQTSKFAEYFVLKDRLLQNISKDPRYRKVQSMLVRTEANRYMKKETVHQTLARMETEAETYLDIEELLDFLTNRGRPKVVEHQIYLQNLHRQLAIIEEEERLKLSLREEQLKLSLREDGSDTTQSDEELSEVIRSKRIKRKQNKLKEIRSGNNFDSSKKFNVTIPSPFDFDSRDKDRKVSIRERKMQEVLQQKERQLQEAMKPIPFKDAPDYIKENQYKRRPAEIKKDEQFAARPLPWYCEINLMPRIEKQNEARSIRIREEVITKHTNYELPDGVQRMLKRQEERQEKTTAKARTASTSRSVCTFVPKISQGVPKFLVTHEDIKFDLEKAKDSKQPLQTMPFSFANRPEKSRTTHQQPKPRPEQMRHSKYERVDNQEEYQNIPKTEKFEALVELRRRQLEEKDRERLKEKRSEAVRKLRESKFAPVVWRALKSSSVDPARSRAIVAGRVKEFKREERQKKEQYENQMIRILTNVYEKPLLLESGVARGNQEEMENGGREYHDGGRERQFENEEEYLEADYQPRGDMRLMLEKGQGKRGQGKQGQGKEGEPQQHMDDEHRRAVVEGHQLGQYPPEGYQVDYDDEEEEENGYENDYNQEYDQHYEHPGNLHTS